MSPWMQGGMAGFAFMLLCVIIWLIKQLLTVLEKTHAVIAANTTAIAANADAVKEETKELQLLRERFSFLDANVREIRKTIEGCPGRHPP